MYAGARRDCLLPRCATFTCLQLLCCASRQYACKGQFHKQGCLCTGGNGVAVKHHGALEHSLSQQLRRLEQLEELEREVG